MPLRKPGSRVLLDNLFGSWTIANAAVGGYWILANPEHPYHPIVLAFYAYKALVKPDGNYDIFHTPSTQVHNAYGPDGMPWSVPRPPTHCTNSGRRVTAQDLRNATFAGRTRGAFARCPECQKRVHIDYENSRRNTWQYSPHEPKDYYNAIPLSVATNSIGDIVVDHLDAPF